jgi:hypothetical protein
MTLTVPDIPLEESLREFARGRVAYSIHAPYENEVGVYLSQGFVTGRFCESPFVKFSAANANSPREVQISSCNTMERRVSFTSSQKLN